MTPQADTASASVEEARFFVKKSVSLAMAVQASASVLITLSRALRLDEDQETYLYELAGKTPRPRRRPAQQARPAMRRLLGQLTETPAVVLGRRLDILAWNAGATALYTDFARIPARRRNYVRLLFTDPAVRALHAEWEHDARIVVAALRMEAAKDPDDPELASRRALRARCRLPHLVGHPSGHRYGLRHQALPPPARR
jgi:MmyB-like transcription regulator ligand binding domain